MIPRAIHYCWFGRKPKTDLVHKCIETWKERLGGYRFFEWNEDTFDIDMCRYSRQAYNLSKFAFTSDVARCWALYTHGGVYLDTDVEVRESLDDFLHHRAFSGFETVGYPFTAVWGAEKDHVWPKLVLESYTRRARSDSKDFDMTTNTVSVSRLLESRFGIDPHRDELQQGTDGVVIYPSTTFCLDLPPNYTVHHFAGSWCDQPGAPPLRALPSPQATMALLRENHSMKHSWSWRLTAPLRTLASALACLRR